MAMILVEMLTPQLVDHVLGIDPHFQVLGTLRFFAEGEYCLHIQKIIIMIFYFYNCFMIYNNILSYISYNFIYRWLSERSWQ